jgi:uncharacterized membrane protein YGL010W
MALMSQRSWDDWISEYGQSHKHPANRFCHTVGIPLIVLSFPAWLLLLANGWLWPVPAAMFVVGWIFQFVGHAYEGKPPEFLSDWRFLFVGMRWWFHKITGRA